MKPNPVGRQLNILDYALRALRRKMVKNLSVFCIFSFVVFLLCSFQLMSRALTEVSLKLLANAPDITVQKMSAGRQVSFPLKEINLLDDIWGIKRIEQRIWGYYFDESNGANYTVVGLNGSLADDLNFTQIDLGWGRFPLPEERGKVVISEDVRDNLQLGERRHFSFFKPDLSQVSYETTGIFAKESDSVAADMILMSLDDARELFALPENVVTDLLIYVANPNEIETVARKIGDRLAGARVITKNQIIKTYKVVFNWRSGLGTICLLAALFTFGILAWDKGTGFSHEDRHEVGILKAVGWQTGDIITLRSYESIIISTLAFLTGYLLGWVHVVFFDGVLLKQVMLGFSVLRPSLPLLPSFAASDMLLLAAISVFPYLCATAVPTWQSATVQTDSVL